MKRSIKLTYHIWIALLVGLSSIGLSAQPNQELEGIVLDEMSKPIGAVSVRVQESTISTSTDDQGGFKIPRPKSGSIMVFSAVGYQQQEIEYSGQPTMSIVLARENTALDEVVVVGYGSQRKSDLTGSVASVKSEQLEKLGPRINFVQALQGIAPGLNVNQSGNSANSGSIGLSVRGQNSIAASNSPLVILDGVPYSGGLNYIDQSTIESVEVLKDASSAAIYGARGANGVILITTKQGKTGKAKVNYNGNYGWKQIYGIPRLLTGPEHWDFGVERYGEQSISAAYPTRVANYNNGVFTDWVKEATQVGAQQKHAITLSGGTEHVSYLLAGNYADVEGIAKGDVYKQATGRANLSIKPVKWIEIGTNTQYTFMDNSGAEVAFAGGGTAPHSNSTLGGAFFMNPLISPYDEDGNRVLYPWPELTNYPNPLSPLNTLDEDYNKRLFSNSFISVQLPIEGLSYKLNTGYTYRSYSRDIFWGSNTVEGLVNNGQAYSRDGRSMEWLIENLLFYNRQFGNHRLETTLLYSAQKSKTDEFSLYTRGFPTEELTWYQPNSAEFISPSRSYAQQSYLSQMARIFYSIKDRYLITATVRRDGYSAFGSDQKFGIFPSVAVGWNMHQEAFMNASEWLNLLKLRLSYGTNGNQAISAFSTLAKMSRSDFLIGPNGDEQGVGYVPNSLENPVLGWESTRSLNVGIDFGFLNNRLFGAIDFYRSNTADLLLDRAISPINGVTTITSNIGEVQNSGIELTLTSRNLAKDNFDWMTTVNVAHNQNKIIDLYGNGQDDIGNGWFLGKPISINYGYLFDGVWQTDDDIPNSHQPSAKPGDLKVADVNQDGAITPDDRTFIGQTAPKMTFGMSNQFSYNQFTLNIMVTGALGVTRINSLWDTDIVFSDALRNTLKQNWWREDNPTNEYPANRDGANPFNVRFYKNANYLRVNNITLTYDFGAALIKRLKFSRLLISAGLINGFTFSSWNGLDPEFGNQRSSPMDRIYNIGLNIVL